MLVPRKLRLALGVIPTGSSWFVMALHFAIDRML